MNTIKVALLGQILNEIKNGSTTSLVDVLNQLTDKQITNCLNQESKEYLESIRLDFELKKGMKLRAKKDLKGKDTNWGSPSMVDIPEGTIFELDSAENNGDLFAILLEGTCVCNSREGNPYQMKPKTHPILKTHIILVDGKSSRHPYDFGLALKSCWEII